MAKFNTEAIQTAIEYYNGRMQRTNEALQGVIENAKPTEAQQADALKLGEVSKSIESLTAFSPEAEFDIALGNLEELKNTNWKSRKANAYIPIAESMLIDKRALSQERASFIDSLDSLVLQAETEMSSDSNADFDFTLIEEIQDQLSEHLSTNIKLLETQVELPRYNAAIKAIDTYVATGEYLATRDQYANVKGETSLTLDDETLNYKVNELWKENAELGEVIPFQQTQGSATGPPAPGAPVTESYGVLEYFDEGFGVDADGRRISTMKGKTIQELFGTQDELTAYLKTSFANFEQEYKDLAGSDSILAAESFEGAYSDSMDSLFGGTGVLGTTEGFQPEELGELYTRWMNEAFVSYSLGQSQSADAFIAAADGSLLSEKKAVDRFLLNELGDKQVLHQKAFEIAINDLSWKELEDVNTYVTSAGQGINLTGELRTIAEEIIQTQYSVERFGDTYNASDELRKVANTKKKEYKQIVGNQFNAKMKGLDKYKFSGGADDKTDDYLPSDVRLAISNLDMTGLGDLEWGTGNVSFDTIDDYQTNLSQNLASVLKHIDKQDMALDDTLYGLDTMMGANTSDIGKYMSEVKKLIDGSVDSSGRAIPAYFEKQADGTYKATEDFSNWVKKMIVAENNQETNVVEYLEDIVSSLMWLNTFETENMGRSSLMNRAQTYFTK